MSDILQSGSEWLAAKLKATASQLVTYQRGRDTVSVSATLGTSEEEVFDSGGGTSMHTRRSDFIVTAEDLVIDGETITPRSGDRIVMGSRTYEVMALADGKVYQEIPFGLLLRIHARLIEV
jgi:hypothetical protein